MSVMAIEPAANLPPPPPEKPLLEQIENPKIKQYLNSLGDTQAYLGGYVQSMGENVDRFFGSKDLDVVYKNNRLIVYTPLTLYDNGDSVSSVNFRAQIDLPKTNNRWKVVVSSFEGDEEEKVDSLNRSEITPSSTQQNDPNSSQNSIAGRYLLSNSENMFSHLDMGLKFINFIEPNPFVKYKIRYKKESSEKIINRGTQTLYFERDKGFAWEGQHVFDYQNSKNWLSRMQTTATWWRDDTEMLVNQRGILFEKVNPYRARAYFVDGNWSIVNEGATFTSTGLGLNVREQLYKDWLFAEVEPRVTWYEADNFNEPFYSLRLMLEMHFYQFK
ncbi:hypothetical protein [Thiomicrorhabdus sp. Kp2]|uniref:hypothetical protein n=1 Tax=Thiomicrorhabdus sp. Kp2 TaxID=1123518 RepID=UPI000415079F|nr:hypothetical protein [Thiomicrorhabdus sp. Kp2]